MTLAIALNGFGQGEMDAYRFARNDLFGTARGVSMAGAFGALGGDITGVAQNPAGIGVYRSSEFTTTLDFTSTDIETNTKGITSSESKFNFHFGNVAYMGYIPLSGEVKSFNFGFSYNRIKNLDRNYSMNGKDLPTSIADYIATTTYGTRLKDLKSKNAYSNCPWLGVLGYDTYMINPVSENDDNYEYERGFFNGETVNNSLSVSERGTVESYDFSLGTNFSDKFYIGATFSITDLHYELSSFYSETPAEGGFLDLKNYLTTDGNGYQFSIGAIYRPLDELRLGVAYHSPTWYNMTDYYYADAEASLEEGGASAGTPDDPPFDYKYRTPDRWVASAAVILGTKAIFSIDYEYSDYSKMNLKDQDGFNLDNNPDYNPNTYISQDYKSASTLRAGLEYRATPQASIRVGYAWMQSPLEDDFKEGRVQVQTVGTIPQYTLEGDANYFTWGGGYKFTPNFYMDIAFAYKWEEDKLYAFSPIIENNGNVILNSTPSKFKNNTFRGLLTLGYKF